MKQLAAIVFFLLALLILASIDRHWRISRAKLFRNCSLLSSFICVTILAIWLSGIYCLETRADFPVGSHHYGEIACFFNQMVFTFTWYSDTPVILERFQPTDPSRSDGARDYSPPESLRFRSGFVGFPFYHSLFGWFETQEESWPADFACKSISLPYWIVILPFAILPAIRAWRYRCEAKLPKATDDPVNSFSPGV